MKILILFCLRRFYSAVNLPDFDDEFNLKFFQPLLQF